jgi:cobalamin synthase
MGANAKEKESLKDEMTSVIEEARMVIPGIQALFGFQTMAVFNNRFEDLPDSGRWAYLAALGFLTLAMGLLMAPAAYHRLAERGQVSRRMIDLSSNLITAGMIPLMLAFAIDVYVVILAAVDNTTLGVYSGIATVCVLAGFWFLFPWAKNNIMA